MPTLETFSGKDLVSDLSGILKTGITGFQEQAELDRKEEVFQEKLKQGEIIADPDTSPEDRKEARILLSTIAPEESKVINALLKQNNEKRLAEAKRTVETGAKRASFVSEGKTPAERKKRWTIVMQDMVVNGESTTEAERIANLPDDEFDQTIQLQEIKGQAMKTLFKDTFVDNGDGTQMNVRTKEITAIPGRVTPQSRLLAQQKTVTLRDGNKKKVMAFNPDTGAFDKPLGVSFVSPDTFTYEDQGIKYTAKTDPKSGKNIIIGQTPITPTKPVSVTIASKDIGNFTPESIAKATAQGGTGGDLVLTEAGKKAGTDAGGTIKLGPDAIVKIGKEWFFKQQIVRPDGTPETVTTALGGPPVNPRTGLTLEQEQTAKAVGAGQKTRAERMATIATQGDLTAASRQALRDEDNIETALQVAQDVPTLQRSLDLMDKIRTGGIDALVLATARSFGVESGNQAELTFNLRQNVLKQLKPTFGAQFTEREGKLLAEIQASESKSTEGNIRLLKRAIEIYDRAIARGRRAATRKGDKVALEDLDAFLEPLAPLTDAGSPAPAQPAPQKRRSFNPETQQFE